MDRELCKKVSSELESRKHVRQYDEEEEGTLWDLPWNYCTMNEDTKKFDYISAFNDCWEETLLRNHKFSDMMNAILKEYGINAGGVFNKKTKVSREGFSRIQKGQSKEFRTIVSICVGLRLDINTSLELMESAGYTFILGNPLHEAYKSFISNRKRIKLVNKTTGAEINHVISACNRKLKEMGFSDSAYLGTVKRKKDIESSISGKKGSRKEFGATEFQKLIKEEFKNSCIYKEIFSEKTGLDQKIFEDLIYDRSTSLKSIIAVCIAIDADIFRTVSLLQASGKVFIPTSRTHQAYRFLIERKALLFEMDKSINIVAIQNKAPSNSVKECAKGETSFRIDLANKILEELQVSKDDLFETLAN